MNQGTIEKILQAGMEAGADFAELYREETRRASVSFSDSKVESATAGTDFGIGIRLLYGSEVLYGFTSDDDEDNLLRLTREIAASREGSSPASVTPVQLKENALSNQHQVSKDPAKVGQASKLDLLRRADKSCREHSDKICQVSASAMDATSDVLIANSEGLLVEDRRVRCRFMVSATAGEGTELFSGSETPGALKGSEFFDSLDIEALATEASARAVLMLSAGYVKGHKMPVVIGSGFGGVIFHEACGHPLETEAIRRKASPFVDKIGKPIAHEKVTAIDDGTMTNVWGSINVDDEGMPAQRTVLIEKGILKNYLSDRIGANDVKVERTGSARRESFQYAPVSRMRNTYIDKGDDSVEAMIESIDEGLYAKKMGGGSVNPATGEFNFAVQEGYLIEKGKVAGPVRGATLIGKGDEILPKISMVSDDLELAAGMCGASSGSVPVTVGQPTLKVDEILVGGRS